MKRYAGELATDETQMKHRSSSICVDPCFICGFVLIIFFQGPAALTSAQEPSPIAAAAMMQRLVTDAIERAEESVVAIARVRKEEHQDGPSPSSIPALETLRPQAAPADPRFVPTEFGTGVVIDSGGLVVTNYHV